MINLDDLYELREKVEKSVKSQSRTNKILFAAAASAFLLSVTVFSNIKKSRYNKICLEMAKVDHDITMYLLESASLYQANPVNLPDVDRDIKVRYHLYHKANKGKSSKQMKAELNELKSRRVKDAHQFNFDLMEIRKASL